MRRPSPRARWARPCHCGRSGARVCRPPTMIPGVRGRLITASFARDVLPSMPGFASPPSSMSPRLGRWAVRLEASLGTTSSVRAIADVALAPLLDLLGLIGVQRIESEHSCALRLTAGGSACLSALTIGWGEPIDRMWRSVVTDGIGSDARWCLCCNGQVLRLVDARRTWSREYLEFDLAQLGHEREAQAVFWALLHAGALTGATPLLDRAVDLSCRHGLEVCKALGAGVLEALEVLLGALAARRPRRGRTLLFEQSLTVLYRVLFLLFAEARGLVPIWHPVYRDRYSLEAIVATLLTGRTYRGLWQAVNAISRLAYNGCVAGELKVTAFNGRLFSPSAFGAVDRTRIDDDLMSRAVLSISTTPASRSSGRTRIAYRDLDVEELGAVYEQVLEYEPRNRELTRT